MRFRDELSCGIKFCKTFSMQFSTSLKPEGVIQVRATDVGVMNIQVIFKNLCMNLIIWGKV